MQNFATVFAQFLSLVAKYMFVKLSKQHKGKRSPRTFFHWDQFAHLLHAQLAGCKSLRDEVMGMNAAAKRLYCWEHLIRNTSPPMDAVNHALKPSLLGEVLTISCPEQYIRGTSSLGKGLSLTQRLSGSRSRNTGIASARAASWISPFRDVARLEAAGQAALSAPPPRCRAFEVDSGMEMTEPVRHPNRKKAAATRRKRFIPDADTVDAVWNVPFRPKHAWSRDVPGSSAVI
jgi:hypothetical protein